MGLRLGYYVGLRKCQIKHLMEILTPTLAFILNTMHIQSEISRMSVVTIQYQHCGSSLKIDPENAKTSVEGYFGWLMTVQNPARVKIKQKAAWSVLGSCMDMTSASDDNWNLSWSKLAVCS